MYFTDSTKLWLKLYVDKMIKGRHNLFGLNGFSILRVPAEYTAIET